LYTQTAPEDKVKRYAILYLATLNVIIPIDFLFLGTVARGFFFTSQVGDMLGDIRLAPAILFYPLYVVGILVFVGAPATATWQSALLYGALFGCVAMRRSNLPLLARAVDRSVRRTDDAMPYLSSA
jgi:uncharacterized membrane protein